MTLEPRQSFETREAADLASRPSWWLEDPFGSMVTGLIAPAAAVGVLASAILGISLAF